METQFTRYKAGIFKNNFATTVDLKAFKSTHTERFISNRK